MVKHHLFLVLGLISCAFAYEQGVLEFTDEDFSAKIAEDDTTLVMFYAPWCGHCKRLKPEFDKAADEVRNDDPPIRLAKIDCTEGGKETCNKFSISGYPTLKIFRNGELSSDYNGPREADGIVKYMRKQVGPSSKKLSTVEEFEKYLDTTDVTIIGFFEKDSDLKSLFFRYADKMREKYRFGHTESSDILDKQGEKDAVVLFRPPHLKSTFEPAYIKFEGTTFAELNEFILKNSLGLCGHRTRENAKEFENPLVIAYYEVDYVKNPKGTNYWRNRVLKAAKEFSGKVTFAISSKHDFQHEINEYGIDLVASKPLVVARDSKNLKYIMKEEFSPDNIREFASKLVAGTLTPYIKSEEIPETNDAPVKIVVAKNFDEVVINNGKDTLIEFYAPWCGHCKKLTPIYEELAEKLEKEDVVIAKMDATANDVPPEFEVRGFPTLFWLPKDSKDKPVAYNGGREVDDFMQYISKHSTNELNGWDRSGKPKKIEL